ncbi:GNAT family N-acetyltransferase [Proteus mirabilis]|uniref:GNAT family N-acetyltransferase n=1 Tax=Proteus mirabilis TaxID=584 RepID=UPI0034D4FCEC
MNILEEFRYLTSEEKNDINNIISFKTYKDVPNELRQPIIDLLNSLEKSMTVYNSEKFSPNKNIKSALGENSASVLLKDGKPVGVIAYKLLNPNILYLPGGHTVLYVSSLFVKDNLRGKGIGKLLMEHIERMAKKLNAKNSFSKRFWRE